MKNYILEGTEPKEADDFLDWARWFETANRVVKQTHFDNVTVSIVFLGLDHSFDGEKPLLFETMIFGGELDGYQRRYSTWNESVKGHKFACTEIEIPALVRKIMRTLSFLFLVLMLTLALVIATAVVASAQQPTPTFTLHPGNQSQVFINYQASRTNRVKPYSYLIGACLIVTVKFSQDKRKEDFWRGFKNRASFQLTSRQSLYNFTAMK